MRNFGKVLMANFEEKRLFLYVNNLEFSLCKSQILMRAFANESLKELIEIYTENKHEFKRT